MAPLAGAVGAEAEAVVFGGYPEFVHLREVYADEEPDDLDGLSEARSRASRLQRASAERAELSERLLQFRLHYNVLLHLQEQDGAASRASTAAQPRAPPRSSERAVPHPTHTGIRRCTCGEMQRLLETRGGWRGLAEPVIFEAPPLHGQPFTSRARILSSDFPGDFATATVLGDGLAAQFGPDWLADGRRFREASAEGCFSQVMGQAQGAGPLGELWRALPPWLRCPMVVVSTGPGGSGVAFHKHSSAWLALLEGGKRWWLYPPGGPPSERAYRALALCPAARLPDAVAALPVEERPVEVWQRPGEAVFVPALWWHATRDEGPTLGVGSQYHVLDLDFGRAAREHPDSAFVLYHHGCEVHKSAPQRAAECFEGALRREPLNFYYRLNQLRFYLNLVWPPRATLHVIRRFLGALAELEPERQMMVLRFAVPSLFDFVEWNMGYDRLLKYSSDCCDAGLEAVLRLSRPFLPGGCRARISVSLPCVDRLRYESRCAQCGEDGKLGGPGDANTVWAHKFYCLACAGARRAARCAACGRVDPGGQLGHAGTRFATSWYCAGCWRSWARAANESAASDPRDRRHTARPAASERAEAAAADEGAASGPRPVAPARAPPDVRLPPDREVGEWTAVD